MASHRCDGCDERFDWEPDWGIKEQVCPFCGKLFEVGYDEYLDEEYNEYPMWWLEPKPPSVHTTPNTSRPRG